MDLLSTMMQRLSKAEQNLRAYQESNREKVNELYHKAGQSVNKAAMVRL